MSKQSGPSKMFASGVSINKSWEMAINALFDSLRANTGCQVWRKAALWGAVKKESFSLSPALSLSTSISYGSLEAMLCVKYIFYYLPPMSSTPSSDYYQ